MKILRYLAIAGVCLSPLIITWAARGASVQPVFTNDTVADTLTFNDTFGHAVQIGTYNPSTGLWTSTGVAGGFTNITVSGNGTVGGTFGITGVTTLGPTVINGAMSGTGFTGAFASPPPIGSTVPSSVAATNLSATGTVTGAGFNSLLSATPVGIGSVTPNGVAATTLSASSTVSGTGFQNYLLSPPAIGNSAPSTGKFTALTGTTSTNFIDRPRSLESFGADNTGVASAVTAVQTALNSGIPLICDGIYKIDSLVTVTNVNATLIGTGMPEGCIFNFTASTSGFYFTEVGTSFRTSNRIRLEHMKVIPQAAITSNGAPHTAAFDIEYPLGTIGTVAADVYIHDVEIMPSSNTNYILNCVYLNDVQTVHIDDLHCEGKRTTDDINSNAIVFNGTHAPTTLTVEHSLFSYVGSGVLMPQVSATGWQGVRVNAVDCVFCYYGVQAFGALDGSSDYLSVTGLEGAYFQSAVTSQNVGHTFVNGNYVFLFNPSAGTMTNPTCFNVAWTIVPLSNISPAAIFGNACDGAQASGYIGSKIGAVYGGFSNALLGGYIGPNNLADLDIGIITATGTNDVFVAKQTIRAVTTEWSNGAAAGNITPIPPMAVIDGSAGATGYVGEVIRSNVVVGSAVPLVNGTAKTVTSVNLTAGDWDCRGAVAFNPNVATTITVISAGINNVTNVEPANGINGSTFLDTAFATGVGAGLPVGTFQINLSAPTTEYLVAESNFGVNTNSAYGNIECRRMR